MHAGLDLDLEDGDPVHVTADGVVTDARQHAEYGNMVTVWHGYGIETRYAHLSRYVVRPGDVGHSRADRRSRRIDGSVDRAPTCTTRCGSTAVR